MPQHVNSLIIPALRLGVVVKMCVCFCSLHCVYTCACTHFQVLVPHILFLQAQPRDYLSRVAWLEGVPLEQLLLDNAAVIKDLDTALNGTQLLLCNPQRGGCE